jgi:hypothetical protein
MPAAFGLSQAAKNWGAILQVFEQRGRPRSSPDKAANPADARTQAVRDGGRDDSRHPKWQRKSKNNSSTSKQ